MRMKPETLIGSVVLSAVALVVAAALFGDGFDGTTAGPGQEASPQVIAPTGPGRLSEGAVQNPGYQGAAMLPVAGMAPGDQTDVAKNYMGPALQLFEAHWQGMDTRLLGNELRRKLQYPKDLQGLVVEEVTLNAASSGLLAGDIVVKLNGAPILSLEDFLRETRKVRNSNQATITVMRKGKSVNNGRYAVNRLTFVMRAEPDLGFAQVEGAPMILAGDPRPHAYRGPCTQCHAIGEGFELTPDPDLIILPPPRITSEIAAQNIKPHRERGACEACHVITR